MLWKKKNDPPIQKNDEFLPMRLVTNDETGVCIEVFAITIEIKKQKLTTKNLWPD